MRFPTIKLALAATALAVAALFSNCKNDSKTAAQAADSSALAGAFDITKGKIGSTFRVRVEQDIASLNMYLSNNGYANDIANSQIFYNLGQIDPNSLELVPLMIKEIPAARTVTEGPHQGQLAYDFEIYEEAAWDNGSPVTGHDVVFTLKMILDPIMPTERWRGYYSEVNDVEVDAANPKKFTAYFNHFYLLGVQTLCQSPIYPAYLYDAAGNLTNVPLTLLLDQKRVLEEGKKFPSLKTFVEVLADPKYGTDPAFTSGAGPYALEYLKAGEGVVLVRKKNWWGDKVVSRNKYLTAYPEKIVYRPVPAEPNVVTMLQNGELDLTTAMSAAKFAELNQNATFTDQYDMGANTPDRYNYFCCNTLNPKLADKRVRQALAHAVDYNYLIKNVGNGLGRRIVGPIAPAKPYYNKDLAPYDFNLETSKKLLADAGWTDSNHDGTVDKKINGQQTELVLHVMVVQTSEASRHTAESIQETAKKVGIGIELVSVDLQKLVTDTRAHNFEGALLAAATFPGADDEYQILHSKSALPGGDNKCGFANAENDKLIEQIRSEPDPAKRIPLYQKMQAVLYDEQPLIFLLAPQMRFVTSKKWNVCMSGNRPGYYEQYSSQR